MLSEKSQLLRGSHSTIPLHKVFEINLSEEQSRIRDKTNGKKEREGLQCGNKSTAIEFFVVIEIFCVWIILSTF